MNENKSSEIKSSSKIDTILSQINSNTKLGEIRKIAKEIKKDHELAIELWSTGAYIPRLLAILIMDKKLITEDFINKLDHDMQSHDITERNNLIDWLMANQLTKDKKLIALMETWINSPFTLLRRVFWYYQGRLRWTGHMPHDNTELLLSTIEENIMQEEPEVQWAMNFTAGWIGIYEENYRERCILLGEKTGLYKDQRVSRGCTPNYLPEFIKIEVKKREN